MGHPARNSCTNYCISKALQSPNTYAPRPQYYLHFNFLMYSLQKHSVTEGKASSLCLSTTGWPDLSTFWDTFLILLSVSSVHTDVATRASAGVRIAIATLEVAEPNLESSGCYSPPHPPPNPKIESTTSSSPVSASTFSMAGPTSPNHVSPSYLRFQPYSNPLLPSSTGRYTFLICKNSTP
ncbi:hypothetical protein K469DRAFT_706658 [Zopfia rhizophila CBS 207.26]|uniref:Uncharacterized protein n=1 Tax=Zopfia rhizophila CBS 207.26 TaxID=1314779 RepID=A0A6A6E418_9PEZI|nr:hypothetical protein K469DRAFT_706658 [Zopfia rhizophila CBS 207.26]